MEARETVTIENDDEQIERLIEHLEDTITTLKGRVEQLERNQPAPLTLSPPMQVYAQRPRLGFWGRMDNVEPGR